MLLNWAAKVTPVVTVAVISAWVWLGEVDWSSTITLGSVVIGVLLGITGLAVFGYGVKWKTAYEAEKAVAASMRDGREAYKLAADRHLEELRERDKILQKQDGHLVELKAKVASLEALPDLSQVVHTIAELQVRQDAQADLRTEQAVKDLGALFAERLNDHDERATERQVHIIRILELVAARLGPDPNGRSA